MNANKFSLIGVLKVSLFPMMGKIGYAISFFIFQALIVKSIDSDSFGVFGSWLVLLEYFSLLGGLGLNASLIYFSKINNVDSWNYNLLNLMIYILVALIYLSGVYFIYDGDYSLVMMAVSAFSIASTNSIVSSYHERGSFLSAGFITLGQGMSMLLYGGIVYIFLKQKITTFDLLAGVTSVYFLYFSLLLYFFKPLNKIKISSIFLLAKNNYFIYGLKGISLNVLGKTLLVSDILVVSIYLDSSEVAYYVVASTLVKASWIFVDSLGQVVFPRLIGVHDSGELLSRLSQISLLISLGALFLFWLLGEFLLQYVYSPEYINAYYSTLILLSGSQGIVIYKLLNKKMAAEDNWSPIYKTLITSVLINVILNFILVPMYGITGAATASFISYWICGVMILRLNKTEVFLDYFNIFSIFRRNGLAV